MLFRWHKMLVSGWMLKSDINANLQDTADHPKGVWNLLPSLRGVEDDDKANIISIGESDRMTLRFVKE